MCVYSGKESKKVSESAVQMMLLLTRDSGRRHGADGQHLLDATGKTNKQFDDGRTKHAWRGYDALVIWWKNEVKYIKYNYCCVVFYFVIILVMHVAKVNCSFSLNILLLKNALQNVRSSIHWQPGYLKQKVLCNYIKMIGSHPDGPCSLPAWGSYVTSACKSCRGGRQKVPIF